MGDRPPESYPGNLGEVVEPRYDELFTLVQAELQRSGFENMLAAGVVLTGGTSKMEGELNWRRKFFMRRSVSVRHTMLMDWLISFETRSTLQVSVFLYGLCNIRSAQA